jgi:hypothetical protein
MSYCDRVNAYQYGGVRDPPRGTLAQRQLRHAEPGRPRFVEAMMTMAHRSRAMLWPSRSPMTAERTTCMLSIGQKPLGLQIALFCGGESTLLPARTRMAADLLCRVFLQINRTGPRGA